MLDYHRSLSAKDVRPTTIPASSSICFPSRTLAPSPIPEQSPELVSTLITASSGTTEKANAQVAHSPHTLAPSPILEQLPEPVSSLTTAFRDTIDQPNAQLVHSSQILAPVPEHWPRYVSASIIAFPGTIGQADAQVPPRRSMIFSPRYVEWAPGISIRESVPPFTLPDSELSP